jgi:hypothetical protein
VLLRIGSCGCDAVIVQVIPGITKDHYASIFRVKWSKKNVSLSLDCLILKTEAWWSLRTSATDDLTAHTIKLKSSLFCLVCGDRVKLRMILSGCINVWTVCTSEYTMVSLLNCIFGQRSHILNLRRSSNMYANCNSSGIFSAIYLIISTIVWFIIYVFGFCNICSDKNSAGWL